jgi:hypothetical protein
MVMHEKAEQGTLPSHAPIGYKNNAQTRGVDIDPINAPLVKSLFEKVASGNYSLQMLEDIMYAEGLRHPLKHTKMVKATLHRIIHNPMYYGEFYWGRKLHKGTHTPIVSRDLWDSAQKALSLIYRPHITKRNFAFKGLLRCSVCNCSILAEKTKNKYTYYRCSFSKGHHKHDGYLREEALAEKFTPIVQSVAIPNDIADWLKDGISEKIKQEGSIINSKIVNIEAELKKTEAKISRLYDMRIDGEINGTIFKTKERELNDIIFSCKAQLERGEKTLKRLYQKSARRLKLLGIYLIYIKKGTFTKKLIFYEL